METKTYTVIKKGGFWHDMDHYAKGKTLKLNEKQARRYVEPKEIELKADPAPAKTEAKK